MTSPAATSVTKSCGKQWTRVINDITEALDKSHYCVSLFIDLSKAFDTIDFSLLKLDKQIGTSNEKTSWFESYLEGRTQCVQM